MGTKSGLPRCKNSSAFPTTRTGPSPLLAARARPDDLMAMATSYDSTGRCGAEIPFSDNRGREFMGGAWRADPIHGHMIAIANAGTHATDALLVLHYELATAAFFAEASCRHRGFQGYSIGAWGCVSAAPFFKPKAETVPSLAPT